MSIIEEFGISKTVYSLYFPETQKVLSTLWHQETELHHLYTNAYTKKQDAYHLGFSEMFKQWSQSALTVKWIDFPYFYPTNGASEAIREQLAFLSQKKNPVLFVFEGEYEGYEAIAQPLGFEIKKIKKELVFENTYNDEFEKGGYFFLSNPSSIDGNHWLEWNRFAEKMNTFKDMHVYIDTVYIGCTSNTVSIDLDHESVKGIFFSLSKSFGVYYHRIGGVYLKEANPLLFGNMWFKNVFSLKFGETLMKEIPLGYFPKQYSEQKQLAIKQIEEKLNITVTSSDSLLLAEIERQGLAFEKELTRNEKSSLIRICITPTLEKIIREE